MNDKKTYVSNDFEDYCTQLTIKIIKIDLTKQKCPSGYCGGINSIKITSKYKLTTFSQCNEEDDKSKSSKLYFEPWLFHSHHFALNTLMTYRNVRHEFWNKNVELLYKIDDLDAYKKIHDNMLPMDLNTDSLVD